MPVDIVVEYPAWQPTLPNLATRAWDMVRSHLKLDPEYEICVLGCDDARITALNTSFREKPAATNVLSWPSMTRPVPNAHHPFEPWVLDREEPELGDIAVAYETCETEANLQGKTFEAHVLHLLIHGMLHLLGFDHISEDDAAVMEATEIEILSQHGVENPYL